MLTTVQQQMIRTRLQERVKALADYYSSKRAKRGDPEKSLQTAIESALQPFGNSELRLELVKSRITFFGRNDTHLINEIAGIVQAHFEICKALSIINNTRDTTQFTAEEFNDIQNEFKEYAINTLNNIMDQRTTAPIRHERFEKGTA
jgi:hypothetical protein